MKEIIEMRKRNDVTVTTTHRVPRGRWTIFEMARIRQKSSGVLQPFRLLHIKLKEGHLLSF